MKKIIFILPCMNGGGAERVAAQLLNEIHRNGYDAEFVLTSQKKCDAVNTDLNPEIPLISLQDGIKSSGILSKLGIIISSIICKCFELFHLSVPAHSAHFSFVANYSAEIKALKSYLDKNSGATVVSFLQPSIPLTLIAARKNKNIRVIFSERGDAGRLMKHRYGYKFITKYYDSSDCAVFQTWDALSSYPPNVAKKGTIISNPVKAGLPAAYSGDRNKYITTFCRISKQKNLPLLLSAFYILHKSHPDYALRIIGDTVNAEGEQVKAELDACIKENNLSSCVTFEPFRKDVHSAIIHDAMYVNSSDYEGISNAMLEAMSIGMPVVCTDCPVGGASQTITDGVNGLLVPCNDAEKLAASMCRIIEDKSLADSLSQNAAKLRDELSLEKISQKWIELL